MCLLCACHDHNKPFKKTDAFKLNDVYKLKSWKLTPNVLIGFDVEHNKFTLARSVH